MLSGNFKPEKNSCGIAQFPCDSTAFLFHTKSSSCHSRVTATRQPCVIDGWFKLATNRKPYIVSAMGDPNGDNLRLGLLLGPIATVKTVTKEG